MKGVKDQPQYFMHCCSFQVLIFAVLLATWTSIPSKSWKDTQRFLTRQPGNMFPVFFIGSTVNMVGPTNIQLCWDFCGASGSHPNVSICWTPICSIRPPLHEPRAWSPKPNGLVDRCRICDPRQNLCICHICYVLFLGKKRIATEWIQKFYIGYFGTEQGCPSYYFPLIFWGLLW